MKALHTHYDNLKVARNAPPEVIRAAYKTLCQQFHPDRHHGHPRATKTFQLINTAYDVLSDPVRRRQHDAWIAKIEARDCAQDAHGSPPRWNGRERRRQPWPAAAAAPTSSPRPRSSSRSVRGMAQRLPQHLRWTAWWSSIALTGAALILIYHL